VRAAELRNGSSPHSLSTRASRAGGSNGLACGRFVAAIDGRIRRSRLHLTDELVEKQAAHRFRGP
jgi:hypothetical protein